MPDLYMPIKNYLYDIENFARNTTGIWLRRYQVEAARLICRSVIYGLGYSFAIVFPRQSGKNECQAQIEAYLLTMFSPIQAEIVKVSPTMRPQMLNSMNRLQRRLEANLMTKDAWTKELPHVFRLGDARITFLSGYPTANVVGATANLLLECDEAQEVAIEKWDRDFAPMAASKNATRLFWGTAWTSQTLLARELRLARQAEQEDGFRRVFVMDGDQVAAEVPEYGKFLSVQVARLGREHPLVRTQYFSEEIDAESGMFPPERRLLMQGAHPPKGAPDPDRLYALLIDVAGEDETSTGDLSHQLALLDDPASPLTGARRDATALTVVEVDLSSLEDELLQAPTYRVVARSQWTGVRHSRLYGRLKALALHWRARHVVIDATGLGLGLASFLAKALPGLVTPFTFTLSSKSDLGWAFLSVVETGRYQEHTPVAGSSGPDLQAAFWRQVELCQSTIQEGPGRLMAWGVPDGTRDPLTSQLVHDDLLVSASFCAVLDRLGWGVGSSSIISQQDMFADMNPVY